MPFFMWILLLLLVCLESALIGRLLRYSCHLGWETQSYMGMFMMKDTGVLNDIHYLQVAYSSQLSFLCQI